MGLERRGWWRIPLSARLIAVVLLGGLLATALLLRAHARERARTESFLQRELLSLVELAAHEDEQLLERVTVLLRVLATVPQVREDAPAACGAYLWNTQAQEPAIMSIGVAAPDGRVVCGSHATEAPLSIADRDYFAEALRTGKLAAGTFTVDRLSGRSALHFAQPILHEGRIAGVIYLAIDIGWLDGYVYRLRLPPGAVVMAWDEKGTILASHPNPERWVGENIAGTALFEQSLARDRGVLQMDFQDESYLWAFTPVGQDHLNRKLHLAITVPTTSVVSGMMQDLRAHLLLLWAVGLVVAVVLLATLYGWIIRPLRRLEQAAVSLESGHLDARARVASVPDEMGRVSAAFNAMAGAFEESTRSREEFINMVAHELKTPLTTFKIQLQRLRMGAADGQPVTAQTVQQTVDAADRQVWRLTQLVESLLDSRAISEDLRPLALETMELSEVVREVVARHQPSFDAAGAPLHLELDENLQGVWDRSLLVQLVHQLLSNALKFGEGQPVSLSTARNQNDVKIVVRDRGMGIRQEDQSRVFERFQRAVPNHSHGGLGLGLWVVRQIARRMHGDVQLCSRSGEGSTFTVTLPRDLSRRISQDERERDGAGGDGRGDGRAEPPLTFGIDEHTLH